MGQASAIVGTGYCCATSADARARAIGARAMALGAPWPIEVTGFSASHKALAVLGRARHADYCCFSGALRWFRGSLRAASAIFPARLPSRSVPGVPTTDCAAPATWHGMSWRFQQLSPRVLYVVAASMPDDDAYMSPSASVADARRKHFSAATLLQAATPRFALISTSLTDGYRRLQKELRPHYARM